MKEKLKELLKKYGLTQNDLAELLGLTYQSISIKMNGHKDFTQSELFKIMVAFNLDPETFIDIFFNIKERSSLNEK